MWNVCGYSTVWGISGGSGLKADGQDAKLYYMKDRLLVRDALDAEGIGLVPADPIGR